MSEKSAAMTERPWTKGPWRAGYLHWGESDVVAPDPASDSFINGEPVRTICRGAYSYADARLIAAAPDLFEALEDAESTYLAVLATVSLLRKHGLNIAQLDSMSMVVRASADKARAALARARGGTL